MDISKLKILIFDLGLQAEMAKTLAEKVAAVRYFVPGNWERYSTPLKAFIGRDLEGVERVEKFFPHKDWADIIILPESQLGEIVTDLRKGGYKVAGPGDEHTWLETKRWEARLAQAETGLPTQASESISGLDNLEKFFKENKNWVVKGNGYRGLFDSFIIKDEKEFEPRKNHLAYHLGPFKNDFPFVVEEVIEGVETGYDTISWDIEQLWPSLLSLAVQEGCYLGKVCHEKDMPEAYRRMHQILATLMKDYRFFYSTETITDKEGIPYLIDLTMRIGSPSPFSIYLELIKNFPELICGMALGEKVEPKVDEDNKYVASVNLKVKNEENFINIEIPSELRRWTKLVNGARHGNDFYQIPDWEDAATIIAFGKTPKEAMDLAKERANEVKGQDIVNNSAFLSGYYNEIEKAKKIGIEF